MNDQSAIRPSFAVPSIKKDEEAKKVGASIEERQLYSLTNLAGWKILKEFKDRTFQEIDAATSMVISEGKSFEEIGRNTVVTNLAKDMVNKIFNKVEDAKDACNAKIDTKEE